MTFEHFWLKESKKGMRPALWNEQCARHAWNAAIYAAAQVALETAKDAEDAAKAKDATDYVAGYQDSAVDTQEAISEMEVEVQT